MTGLSPHGSRSPINLQNLSEEDRAAHRRWSRASLLCLFTLIAGLLAVGLSAHSPRFVTTMQQDQTVGIDINAGLAGQRHPGG